VARSLFSQLEAMGRAEGHRRVVAINLSGATLADDGLLEYIRATGREFAIAFD